MELPGPQKDTFTSVRLRVGAGSSLARGSASLRTAIDALVQTTLWQAMQCAAYRSCPRHSAHAEVASANALNRPIAACARVCETHEARCRAGCRTRRAKGLAVHQHRNLAVRQHFLGFTAHQQSLRTASAVRSHHDQVASLAFCGATQMPVILALNSLASWTPSQQRGLRHFGTVGWQ